jgi:hypothetical protein
VTTSNEIQINGTFERGAFDEVTVNYPDIGEISKITVAHRSVLCLEVVELESLWAKLESASVRLLPVQGPERITPQSVEAHECGHPKHHQRATVDIQLQ